DLTRINRNHQLALAHIGGETINFTHLDLPRSQVYYVQSAGVRPCTRKLAELSTVRLAAVAFLIDVGHGAQSAFAVCPMRWQKRESVRHPSALHLNTVHPATPYKRGPSGVCTKGAGFPFSRE